MDEIAFGKHCKPTGRPCIHGYQATCKTCRDVRSLALTRPQGKPLRDASESFKLSRTHQQCSQNQCSCEARHSLRQLSTPPQRGGGQGCHFKDLHFFGTSGDAMRAECTGHLCKKWKLCKFKEGKQNKKTNTKQNTQNNKKHQKANQKPPRRNLQSFSSVHHGDTL